MWQSDLLQIFLSALAVWRISNIIIYEDGPFFVFKKLRFWIGAEDFFGEPTEEPNTIQKLFQCIWCLSIYVSIPFAFNIVPDFITLIFAISALALYANKHID